MKVRFAVLGFGKVVVAIVFGLVVGLLNSWSASAVVSMPLDPSFGNGGRVLTDVSGGNPEDEPFDLLLLPDGKLAMPGKSYQGPSQDYDFTVLQHNPNGSLDSTFGGDGIVTTDFLGGHDEALGLARQADGKLIAAGEIVNPAQGASDFGLVRYNPDGSIDTSFGNSGRVITDFSGGADLAFRVAIQSDEKIVAVGTASRPQKGFDFALARYNPDGSLDQTFGVGGLVTTDFLAGADMITGIHIFPGGGMLVSGVATHTRRGNTDFGLARYDSSGKLVSSFGWGGIVMTDFAGKDDIGYSLAIQTNGDFLVGGLGFNPATNSNDMAIARYRPNGALDLSFATSGKPGVSLTDLAKGYDQILDLAIQPDGKILGAGHSVIPGRGFDFALVRYNFDGTLDSTFGWAGRIAWDNFRGPDGLHGLVLLSDGKAVVAGDTYNPSTGGDDFYIARLLFADPDWIAGVVAGLPASSFSAPGQQAGIIQELDTIESQITAGQVSAAVTGLQSLRSRIDGCGATADSGDWIVDCTAQLQVRGLIDQLIGKL